MFTVIRSFNKFQQTHTYKSLLSGPEPLPEFRVFALLYCYVNYEFYLVYVRVRTLHTSTSGKILCDTSDLCLWNHKYCKDGLLHISNNTPHFVFYNTTNAAYKVNFIYCRLCNNMCDSYYRTVHKNTTLLTYTLRDHCTVLYL